VSEQLHTPYNWKTIWTSQISFSASEPASSPQETDSYPNSLKGDGRGYRYRTSWWQSRKLFARVWDHYWSVNKTQHKNASLERNSIATGIYVVIAATHIKLTGHCSKVSRAEARIDRTFALDTYHVLGAHGIQFPVTGFVILRMFLAGDIRWW